MRYTLLLIILWAFELPAQVQPIKKVILANEMQEISGITWYRDTLWAINDGGNSAQILAIDTLTGAVTRRITLKNAVNNDWEALTHDGSHLYIGDIGNNQGVRQNLMILRVKLPFSGDSVLADSILYNYPDQSSFSPAPFQTPFDAECLLVNGDSLIIMTKRWNDLSTRSYSLPKIPGIYSPSPGKVTPLQGLCGGGYQDTATGETFLIGYPQNATSSLIWKGIYPFSSPPFRSPLSLDHFQAEAIAGNAKNRIWAAHEGGNGVPPTMYVLGDLTHLSQREKSIIDWVSLDNGVLRFTRNGSKSIQMIDLGGKLHLKEAIPPGVYEWRIPVKRIPMILLISGPQGQSRFYIPSTDH